MPTKDSQAFSPVFTMPAYLQLVDVRLQPVNVYLKFDCAFAACSYVSAAYDCVTAAYDCAFAACSCELAAYNCRVQRHFAAHIYKVGSSTQQCRTLHRTWL